MVQEAVLFLFKIEGAEAPMMINRVLDRFDDKNVTIILDRDAVFNRSHISSAVMHAARSILRGEARARVEALEVIRWLTGSHQVSKGQKIANPKPATTNILVLILPRGWPKEGDDASLPGIKESELPGDGIEGLVSMKPPFDYGGREALKRMDLDIPEGSDLLEMEKMVLEKVCLLGLK